MISTDSTHRIIQIFNEINRIPRCSKREEQISNWLYQWGLDHHFHTLQDSTGNILIKVPASQGLENAPVVVLQGHMDMVCEKNSDSSHNFTTDPIQSFEENGWLMAKETTLGADNGIALAMALYLAEEQALVHPPLELLFTVDEETGLIGANSLSPDFVEGRILINIDSEEEGEFTIGCAGGRDSFIKLDLEKIHTPEHLTFYMIKASGFKGGHSGTDINAHRANANRIIARALNLISRKIPFYLSEVEGGNAHNAIPREAKAVIACASESLPLIQELLYQLTLDLKNEYNGIEPYFSLSVYPAKAASMVISKETSKVIIGLLTTIPHGVESLTPTNHDLVESSVNFAKMYLDNDTFTVMTSERSAIMSMLDNICQRLDAIGGCASASVTHTKGYPSWEANWDSPLLKRCTRLYQHKFNQKPVVKVIHAGLECGIIGNKYGGMDMISLGPTIEHPHSPDERIELASIERVWDFMIDLLANIGADK